MEKIYHFYVLSSTDFPNEIRYVGVTMQTVEQRFYKHKYCAVHPEKRGLPVHKWMWSKYEKGLDVIVKEVDTCGEKDWEDREKYWISKYREGGKLLNISEGGSGVIPKEARSKDSIQRSSEGHYKQITLLDIYGNVIEHCPSVKYACEKYGIAKTAVGNVLSGRSKTTKGFYIVETEKFNNIDFNVKNFIQSLNDKTSRKKIIYKYDLNGNLLEALPSIAEYYKKYKYDREAIERAIKNKRPYKDMYWSTTNTLDLSEYKSIYKYEWNDKKYRSLPEIAKDLNIPQGTIGSCFYQNRLLQGHKINKL